MDGETPLRALGSRIENYADQYEDFSHRRKSPRLASSTGIENEINTSLESAGAMEATAVPLPDTDGKKSKGRPRGSVSKKKLRMQRLRSARTSPRGQLATVDAVPPLDILGIRSSQQHGGVSSILPFTQTSLPSQRFFQQNSNLPPIWRRVQASQQSLLMPSLLLTNASSAFSSFDAITPAVSASALAALSSEDEAVEPIVGSLVGKIFNSEGENDLQFKTSVQFLSNHLKSFPDREGDVGRKVMIRIDPPENGAENDSKTQESIVIMICQGWHVVVEGEIDLSCNKYVRPCDTQGQKLEQRIQSKKCTSYSLISVTSSGGIVRTNTLAVCPYCKVDRRKLSQAKTYADKCNESQKAANSTESTAEAASAALNSLTKKQLKETVLSLIAEKDLREALDKSLQIEKEITPNSREAMEEMLGV